MTFSKHFGKFSARLTRHPFSHRPVMEILRDPYEKVRPGVVLFSFDVEWLSEMLLLGERLPNASERHAAGAAINHLLILDRARTLEDEKRAQEAPKPRARRPIESFIVKHYISDRNPSLKGNGFDGLRIGDDREEAEAFVEWVNARLCELIEAKEAMAQKVMSESLDQFREQVKTWHETVVPASVRAKLKKTDLS